MVAREAGVAVGTVYLHFAGREALLQEVLDAALDQLKLSLAASSTDQTARTAVRAMRQRADGLVAFADDHRALAAVLFNPAHLGAAAGDQALEYLVASQSAALSSDRSRGWLRTAVDTEVMARALVGSLVQVLGWWSRQLLEGRQAPAREVVAGQLADLRLYGTCSRPRE